MTPPLPDLLVIGFGSDLRGDDAAGRRVAETVEALGLPGVAVRSVHQLVPELAADLAGCRRAVFVDAAVDCVSVEVRSVAPASGDGALTHRFDPPALLALAATLGDVPEEAVVVTVPARDLGLGEELSPAASAGLREAVRRVAALATRDRSAQDPQNPPAQRKSSSANPYRARPHSTASTASSGDATNR